VCNLVLKDGINNYDTTISFTFGLIGNSGTNYTLSIVNKNGSAALQKEKNLLVEVSLRDGNNERVPLNLTEQYRDKEDELFQFRTHTDL
jgi:hypothetical protein